MAIEIGQQLGSHEITALLGKGGMGEVYRARDLKLKREVAIKILPDEFSRDGDRLSRFQREAEVLASLNHPNIAGIYDLQEVNGSRFLVLELVEGETLADRIARGPIPIDEALNIARDICEALEAAHDKGIIHRDLKPANVKITTDGKVKVLDFGLAKAIEGNMASPALSNSPTMLSGTMGGIILGTAAYMSPEQAKGRPVDRRTDIFALGCVLYEMLTALRAFDGDDGADIIGAVLKTEPDWSKLPADVPKSIRALLRSCLEKNIQNRRRDAGDLRMDIQQALSAEPETIPSLPVSRNVRRTWILWSIATVALCAICIGLTVRYLSSHTDTPHLVQFSIDNNGTPRDTEAVSPDGRYIAYGADKKLFIRALDKAESQEIANTGEAPRPFWSPDGKWVGFFSAGKLSKVSLATMKPQVICENCIGSPGATATWNQYGTILVGGSHSSTPIYKISEGGGVLEPVTTFDSARSDTQHYNPRFLPDGVHFLYLIQTQNADTWGIYVGSLQSNELKLLLKGYGLREARYIPPGYLAIARDGDLWIQAFDPDRLQLSGAPTRLIESIGDNYAFAAADFSVAGTNVLAWRTRPNPVLSQLAWFDRSGKELGRVGNPDRYSQPQLAPDGRRILVAINYGAEYAANLWIFDELNISRRLTSEPGTIRGLWSPNGAEIIYKMGIVNGGKTNGIKRGSSTKNANKSIDVLKELPDEAIEPYDWCCDGKYLVYTIRSRNIAYVSPDHPETPQTYDGDGGYQSQVSPNGKWIAYYLKANGKDNVFVDNFPKSGHKQLVSPDGGGKPRWSHDGRELFFVSSDRQLVSRSVSEGTDLKLGPPVSLFKTPLAGTGGSGGSADYDITPDGQRFLIRVPVERPPDPPSPIHVMLNWAELLPH